MDGLNVYNLRYLAGLCSIVHASPICAEINGVCLFPVHYHKFEVLQIRDP